MCPRILGGPGGAAAPNSGVVRVDRCFRKIQASRDVKVCAVRFRWHLDDPYLPSGNHCNANYYREEKKDNPENPYSCKAAGDGAECKLLCANGGRSYYGGACASFASRGKLSQGLAPEHKPITCIMTDTLLRYNVVMYSKYV